MSRSGGHSVTRVLHSDIARLVAGDLDVDPVLILGNPGIDSWEIGPSAAFAETHHSSLDPQRVAFNHQWTA